MWCKMKGLLRFWCWPETALHSKSLLYTIDQEAEKLKIYIRKATPLHNSTWLSLNEVPWGFCFAWCPCQPASMRRSYQREPLRSTHQIRFNLCLYAHCLSSRWPLLGSGPFRSITKLFDWPRSERTAVFPSSDGSTKVLMWVIITSNSKLEVATFLFFFLFSF